MSSLDLDRGFFMKMERFKAWIIAHPEYNGLRHTYGDALFNHDNGVFRVRALRLAYEVFK